MIKDAVALIGGIVGAVGGTVGLYTSYKKGRISDRIFNQETYRSHFALGYKSVFDNPKCPETDRINIYNLVILVETLKEFSKKNNKFKGFSANNKFRDAVLYAGGIKIDNWFWFMWYNQDLEVNNEHSIEFYDKNKVHIARFEPFFKEFFLEVFENID